MLEELGLDYENVPANFATGDTREPDYLKLNPNGHIPALDDDGVVLFESLAINLYLARKYGKDLWPKTVEDEGHRLGGDFGVADLNVAAVVAWAKLAKIDRSGSKHAAACLARCTGRPAVKRAQGRSLPGVRSARRFVRAGPLRGP